MDLILLERLLLSGSVLRDRSVQVEDNTNRPLGVSQGLPRPLNRDENDCD